MIPISENISLLLSSVEHFANRKFHFRSAVSALMELAATRGQQKVFDDIIFLAKFLRNAHALMQRIGPEGEGYQKLSVEFQESHEKFSTLLKTLVKESPREVKDSFRKTFFSLSTESMQNLMQLATELSWIKNFAIDTKQAFL